MALASGTCLGAYEILAPLGAGGMGEVYRARDARLGREVAVKVLPERLAKDAEALARFEREARSLAALSHPNLVAIHDVGRQEEIFYAVMELLRGETLRDRLRRSPVPWRKAVELGIGIAGGLAAAHDKGIIHRDIKPDNIFLTTDGAVKLLDFGLARVEGAAGPPDSASSPTMTMETKPGTLLGTVAYMSPEQVRGQPADARSDIFSFAGVLYEMVTGRRPFFRQTPADTMAAILNDDPPELAESGTSIPPELERIITRGLEKRPERRFQAASDLTFDLQAILRRPDVTRTVAIAPPSRSRLALWITAVGVTVITLLAVLAVFNVGGWRDRLSAPPDAGRIKSLAVLPFEDLSPEPAEWFSDGMTEEMIATLGRLQPKKLGVIARTSSMHYKGTDKTIDRIGRELGVDYILEGSVRRAGQRVRITAQLIQVSDQTHLWADSFEDDLADVFAVQAGVARRIADSLTLELLPGEQARLGSAPTVDPKAHDAYLKGLFCLKEWAFDDAIEHFEGAIRIAPDYAPAYAGLAHCYAEYHFLGDLSMTDAMPKAKAAARMALQLDETLPEGHVALGYALLLEWDWLSADREFKRAIQVSPSHAAAHFFYAEYCQVVGRFDEAIAEMARTRQLDPLSQFYNVQEGGAFLAAGHYDRAVEHLRLVLEFSPDSALACLYLGKTYLQKGMYEEGIAELRRYVDLWGADPDRSPELGYAYALSGNRDAAWKIIDRLTTEADTSAKVPAGKVALIYTALGEKDEAFAWLKKACEEHDRSVLGLKADHGFDSLRDDPRFDDLLRRIGLEP